jgi:hypothetical protein
MYMLADSREQVGALQDSREKNITTVAFLTITASHPMLCGC